MSDNWNTHPSLSWESHSRSSASHGSSNVYHLNLSPADLPDSAASSPRVSDVGGLSKFLPSNHEPDLDAITAWAGALKSMAAAAGASSGASALSPAVSDASVYSSDEFRMYEFKVRRCMRGRSHDWTDCPFAHPGEKARRRDPRKFTYSGTPCPEFRKGSCRKGDACEHAHGVFECWLHPARYRSQPCKDGPHCKRRVCFFAHTPQQLRLTASTALAISPQEGTDSSTVAADTKSQGGGGGAGAGATKLSPTSTLAGTVSVSPRTSPPATPSLSSPPASPGFGELGGGGCSAASLSGAASSPPSARYPPMYPSMRSQLSRSFSGMAAAVAAASAASSTSASTATSPPYAIHMGQGGQVQGRQLERFHSLPALSIPTGAHHDVGPLSSMANSPSPSMLYSHSPSTSHHRLALMHAANAAAAAAAAASAGTSPYSPFIHSQEQQQQQMQQLQQQQHAAAMAAMGRSQQQQLQYAEYERAALMSELVANIHALQLQSSQQRHLQQLQQQQQDEEEQEVRMQQQYGVGGGYMSRSVGRSSEPYLQEDMQQQTQVQGLQRYSEFQESIQSPRVSRDTSTLWNPNLSSGKVGNNSFFGGREEDDDKEVVEERSDKRDGLEWVNSLISGEEGDTGGKQGMSNNQGASSPGMSRSMWDDVGRWVPTAHG